METEQRPALGLPARVVDAAARIGAAVGDRYARGGMSVCQVITVD